jgi:hypothetical protein
MAFRFFLCPFSLLLTITLWTGCGGSSPTTPAAPTPTPTPAPAPGSLNVNGSWSGTTSSGGRLSFTIANASLTNYRFEPLCSGIDLFFGSTGSAGAPIQNNAFTYTSSNPPVFPSYTLTGQFSSATGASGTFIAAQINTASCSSANFSWTATKQ